MQHTALLEPFVFCTSSDQGCTEGILVFVVVRWVTETAADGAAMPVNFNYGDSLTKLYVLYSVFVIPLSVSLSI